ncbi:uncharacterized protein LOC133330232 [Musca vetustissima]|uniref:uncharacterized protein LOC133330232 n=1 Tax=Musca vetustissima TaxID=27455 RepID=UPI002AB5FE6E|nr:uncharacterized protein LOC133330232 [Musca vetustissima]
MIKFVVLINLLQLIWLIDCKIYKKGPLLDNSVEEKWNGLWFPKPPNYHYDVVSEKDNVADIDSWQGTWFPHAPGISDNKYNTKESNEHTCDNGKDNINIDFDPEDKRHSYNYLCLGNRTVFEPNFNTTTILIEHFVPAAYQPAAKCLNETISYGDSLPTFGPYRPLAPKFGNYKYLPPQRWLRSLSDGGIVMLYHPCAFSGQIKQLQNILQGCLYRHIITPSQLLTPQRPLALLAWGKCLQMSVVDDNTVVNFIKENAKLGLRGQQTKLNLSSQLYDAGLLTESHLVTDEQDSEICGYKDM